MKMKMKDKRILGGKNEVLKNLDKIQKNIQKKALQTNKKSKSVANKHVCQCQCRHLVKKQ